MSRGLIDRAIAKLTKRTNFSLVDVTGSAVSIGGYGAAWVAVPAPSNKKVICAVGYYLNGYVGMAPYIYYMSYNSSTKKATLAIFNNGSPTINTTPIVQFLCVDE